MISVLLVHGRISKKNLEPASLLYRFFAPDLNFKNNYSTFIVFLITTKKSVGFKIEPLYV